MKAEYINPFIEASQSVISEVTGFEPKLGEIFIKNIPYRGECVVVLIGLTGEIRGTIIISLSKKLSCQMASAMMMGMTVTELDEVVKSAVAELCNMILGNAAILFGRSNINIDITPPTVLTGDNMQFSPSKSVVICIPLLFDGGEVLEIDVTYKEK